MRSERVHRRKENMMGLSILYHFQGMLKFVALKIWGNVEYRAMIRAIIYTHVPLYTPSLSIYIYSQKVHGKWEL